MTRSEPMTVMDRVRRHRAKERAAQIHRFEVSLAVGLIDDVRALAKRQNKPVWEVVEAALLAVTDNADGVNVNHEK